MASGGALVYFPFDPDALRMEAMLAQYRQAEPGQIEAKAVEHLVVLEVAPRGEWAPWVGWGWGGFTTENGEILREGEGWRVVFRFCSCICVKDTAEM